MNRSAGSKAVELTSAFEYFIDKIVVSGVSVFRTELSSSRLRNYLHDKARKPSQFLCGSYSLCGAAIQIGSPLFDPFKEKSVGAYYLMGGLCFVTGIVLPCFAAKFWNQMMERRNQSK